MSGVLVRLMIAELREIWGLVRVCGRVNRAGQLICCAAATLCLRACACAAVRATLVAEQAIAAIMIDLQVSGELRCEAPGVAMRSDQPRAECGPSNTTAHVLRGPPGHRLPQPAGNPGYAVASPACSPRHELGIESCGPRGPARRGGGGGPRPPPPAALVTAARGCGAAPGAVNPRRGPSCASKRAGAAEGAPPANGAARGVPRAVLPIYLSICRWPPPSTCRCALSGEAARLRRASAGAVCGG
eukprot:scaffold21_cov368-Prasinococcus_capsulatus_cf.AAC.2